MNFILTESKMYEIKRVIGSAFANILMQITYKRIINKRANKRTDLETLKLTTLLRKQTAFKNMPLLNESDYRTLAKGLTYVELDKGENIYEYGDPVENFYIVLRGNVGIFDQNQQIPLWNQAYNKY